jgi:hypothetical protein
MASLNLGRKQLADAFETVLTDLEGRSDITETDLKNAWLEELAGTETLTINGWYSPENDGLSILTCSEEDFSRSHFKSLRDQQGSGRSRYIDWRNGLLFVYASNVSMATGLPADFSTTIYFGRSRRVLEHLRNSVSACSTILTLLTPDCSAADCYQSISGVLGDYSIDGRTWSVSQQGYNYGHTLPLWDRQQIGSPEISRHARYIGDIDAHQMRSKRLFMQRQSDWRIDEHGQFTIEPQCVALKRSELPKVSLHYVLQVVGGELHVCREGERFTLLRC